MRSVDTPQACLNQGVKSLSINHQDRIIKLDNYPNLPAVILWFYKIKNVNNFYSRDHPKNLNPISDDFVNYWTDFEEKCVNGVWVNDEGNWVFMYPKLFWYINYVTIFDKRKGRNRIIQPDLTVTEWIVFSYLMCIDGFSGFEDDEDYTCHEIVGKIEKNKSLEEGDKINIYDFEIQRIPSYCRNKQGEFKTYVDPWEYLTRVYLHDDNRKKPLGKAMYDNSFHDAIILGGRGTAKSYCIFSGDLSHEWAFGGIKDYREIHKVNTPNIFACGSTNKTPLLKSLAHLRQFFDNMPGKYSYTEDGRPDYGGPFFRLYSGTWDTGGVITNVVKNSNASQSVRVKGPSLYINSLTPDNFKIGAGDRTKRQYIEEFGFLSFAKSVYNANKDSLRLGEDKTGSSIGLGTAGDMGSIEEPKEIFENPEGFEVFGITNYYKNFSKKTGLFLSCLYAYRNLFDENGNIDLEKLLSFEIQRREEKKKSKDTDTVNSDITFNPITPDEMLIPSGFSLLPKVEAQKQIAELDAFNLDDKIINYGEIVLDEKSNRGVSFEVDRNGKSKLIDTLSFDVNSDLTSILAVAQHPIDNAPDGLYYIVYDPVRNKIGGPSLNSMIVYKGILTDNPKDFDDNIVALRVWRDRNLTESYRKVLMTAKYYNAKIFPERTVPGFTDFCDREGASKFLVPEPKNILKSLGFNYKNYTHGYDMNNERLKYHTLDKISEWLRSCHDKDKVDGFCQKQKIGYIVFKQILEQIKAHNVSGNFDIISNLQGLVLLREELREKLKVNKVEEDSEKPVYYVNKKRAHRVRQSKFLN